MVTKMLRKVCFFKALTPKEINQILSIARLKLYKSGDLVFMKEDIGNTFFIVKSGRIKIYTSIGSEKKKTFAFLKKGDFFGEMSLIDDAPRSASVMDRMRSETMRPAPVWVGGFLAAADPVRRYCPGVWSRSTARRTRSHVSGRSCHSSIRTGRAPVVTRSGPARTISLAPASSSR